MKEPNISARILADSANPANVRLTSFLLTYPRFIHSELMTHRAFSRNAASSRAIPFKKMVEAVDKNPAHPEYWAAEQKGMQGGAELSPEKVQNARNLWRYGKNQAVFVAQRLAEIGVHKSIANRRLECDAHMTVIVTATAAGIANFFALRAHPAAQPEFQVLAYRMLDIYYKNPVRAINWGGWHIPVFHTNELAENENQDTQRTIKIATARCARLSYLTFDGEYDPQKDIELHDRLAASGHFSPFEHCAQAKEMQRYPSQCVKGYDRSQISNFDIGYIANPGYPFASGWLQYRKTLENECVTQIDPAAILAQKPAWITLL